jgi:hypothetical protein
MSELSIQQTGTVPFTVKDNGIFSVKTQRHTQLPEVLQQLSVINS